MSVPTWKRTIDENLRVLTLANEIRYDVDMLLFRKFWLKNMDNVIRKKYRPKPEEQTCYNEYKWFFEKEQNILFVICANLSNNITGANSIYPYNKNEYKQRRSYHNRAIVNVCQIKAELNHIVMIADVNVNKYIELNDKLDEELKMLRAWKKAANKFKKNLVDL